MKRGEELNERPSYGFARGAISYFFNQVVLRSFTEKKKTFDVTLYSMYILIKIE